MRWLLLLLITGCDTQVYTPDYGDDAVSESDEEPTESEVDESDPSESSESEASDPSQSESESDEVSETDESEESDDEEAWPLITEVCDHADYGNVKYVEIYNPADTSIDLEGWTLDRYSNGGSTASTVSLDGVVLAPGDVWVIANSTGSDDFETLFGRAADQYSGNVNGNGNDVYVLSEFGARTVDIFGDIGVDGEGTDWEYTDSVARRKAVVTEPHDSWLVGEWDISTGAGDADPFSR